jgi:hypothetical protein
MLHTISFLGAMSLAAKILFWLKCSVNICCLLLKVEVTLIYNAPYVRQLSVESQVQVLNSQPKLGSIFQLQRMKGLVGLEHVEQLRVESSASGLRIWHSTSALMRPFTELAKLNRLRK